MGFIKWAVACLAGFGCTVAPAAPAAGAAASPPGAATTPAAIAPGLNAPTLSDVAERTVQSVVNISSTRAIHLAPSDGLNLPFFQDPFFHHLFQSPQSHPQAQEGQLRSLGSGVVISRDGLILTNNHVVSGADDIRVSIPKGPEFSAKVVGTDPQSDLAVLRVSGRDASELVPLPFGDSSQLRLGEIVLAVGSPFGLSRTVTMGIVSAVGRANVGIADYEDFIQTDAAINPGNSGGALVNLRGELVGINTAIATKSGGYQGVGFAIPSNMAKSILDSLVQHGKVVRGWLGVAIQGIDAQLESALKLPDARGALVSDVSRDSPAAGAGIERGDVIVEVQGQRVDGPAALRNAIALEPVGTRAKVSFLRNGSERTVEVTIGELPASARAQPAQESRGILSGVTVAPLDSSARAEYGVSSEVDHGVVVTEVKPGSAADSAGLAVGDVIMEMDHRPVDSVADFSQRYANERDGVLLLVRRGQSSLFIALGQ